MEIKVPSGKYILAVSGGVDSMVLLDLLADKAGVELVVAHFNHGIRRSAGLDEALVEQTAKRHGLVFEAGRADLGSDTSEADARKARYRFLDGVVCKHKASKIITAHHQDDWIETVLINLLRGTGRQGISAMLSNPKVLRPLMNKPKPTIVRYATANGLLWNEDSTNKDQEYLRNYLRASVVPRFSAAQREELLKNLDKVAETNIKLDKELATISHYSKKIDRIGFSNLPTKIGQELIVYLLRQLKISDYDARTVERLSLALKTAKPNTFQPVKHNTYLDIGRSSAIFVTP